MASKFDIQPYLSEIKQQLTVIRQNIEILKTVTALSDTTNTIIDEVDNITTTVNELAPLVPYVKQEDTKTIIGGDLEVDGNITMSGGEQVATEETIYRHSITISYSTSSYVGSLYLTIYSTSNSPYTASTLTQALSTVSDCTGYNASVSAPQVCTHIPYAVQIAGGILVISGVAPDNGTITKMSYGVNISEVTVSDVPIDIRNI